MDHLKGFGQAKWSYDNRERSLFHQYKFYLALENGVCIDFISDKFSPMQYGPVPIVSRTSDYDGKVPGNSFIAVDDFISMESLANYLKFLDRNPKAYMSHHEWRKWYSIGNFDCFGQCLCALCERLHRDMPAKSLKNLTRWWKDDGELC